MRGKNEPSNGSLMGRKCAATLRDALSIQKLKEV